MPQGFFDGHLQFSFSRATPFGVWGGPEKDRNVCVFWWCSLRSLSSDSSGQLDVFGHDGNSPGVDGAQVGVLKQPYKVGLHCFLETQYSCRLEPQVCLEVLGDLSHQPLERQFLNEECCTLLEVANVTECCCARPVSVWLDLSAFHSCPMYLLQLSFGPVQCMLP